MRTRSKIEVEIRNILSEVLLVSLKDKEMSASLYIIFRFCQFVKEKDMNRIRFTELLNYEEGKHWLKHSWKCGSKGLNFDTIFELDSENYVKLKGRFERHLISICTKSRLYWNFITSLYSKEDSFNPGIEGEIKKGVLLFNECFYFECHEFLEGIWRKEKGREKDFLKGLIHAAVAFYHLECENYKGTVNYLRRSYRRLKEFEPVFLSVDIKTFLDDLESYLRYIEKSNTYNLESLKRAIPRISLIE